MNTELVQASESGLEIADLAQKARGYARASKADATRKAYASQLRTFAAWCASAGLQALPAAPSTVALYLTHLAESGAASASMAQALSAISQAHVTAHHASPRTDPALREIWRGILNTKAKAGETQKQARALEPKQLLRMVKTGEGLGALRDRALLLMGFASGSRRSELAALDVADVSEDTDGLIIRIGRSKTDQQGKGREVGIPYGSERATCPVRAFKAWVGAAGLTEGALFRGVRYGRLTPHRIDGGDVARIVKRAAKRARVSAAGLSGHSLRAGLCTAAAKAGKSVSAIKAQTGHKSDAMVQRYVRRGTIFEDNAAAGIGL